MKYRDFIFVKDLAAKVVVGKDAWQRTLAQPLKLTLGINVAHRLKHMGLSDDLRRTLNYDFLATKVIERLESAPSGFPQGIEEAARAATGIVKEHTNQHESVVATVSLPKAMLRALAHEVEVASDQPETVVESIKGLSVPVIIGINELERIHKQNVQLDLSVTRPPNMEVFNSAFADELVEYISASDFLTLESFTNAVADFVGTRTPIADIEVEARKPSALNLAQAAAVRVRRTSADFEALAAASPAQAGDHIVYIAFGTNQGDRVAAIQSVLPELEKRNVHVEQASAIYESVPMYYEAQPRFLNGVLRCHTPLDPHTLLAVLKSIEYGHFDRVKKFDNGPRTMDLDVILYDNEVVDTDTLTIPHRDMLNRSFVLRPLNDVYRGRPFPEIDGGETMIVPVLNGAPLIVDPVTSRVPAIMMAIMNATPDSFSDGGDLNADTVGRKALQHIANGATILDVGGYSTRPNAAVVSPEEELRRVVTTVKAIRTVAPGITISVDTFRAGVAEAALLAGANAINDVFSGMADPRILDVASASHAPIILGHARGDPATMKSLTTYAGGVVAGVATELRQRIEAALQAGCQTWQLLLDPGLGFAKKPDQDLEVVRRLAELRHSRELTYDLPLLPWVLGPSRKSFIGHFSQVAEPKQRVNGTIAALTALVQQGADIVRVHDTKDAGEALKIANALYRGNS